VISPTAITLPWSVCLFVCMSVTFVYRAQTAEDINIIFLHTTAACLFQIVLKFGLHRSTPSYPHFAHKWPTPVDMSVEDIRWQNNCGRMVRDSATENGVPIGHHHRSFEWQNRWPHKTFPSPKMGIPNAPNERYVPFLQTIWPLLSEANKGGSGSVSTYCWLRRVRSCLLK